MRWKQRFPVTAKLLRGNCWYLRFLGVDQGTEK